MSSPRVKPKARILLVDDHAVLRQGMRRLIEAEPDMEVVGEADDGSEVETLVRELHPVVMDLSMPKMSGMETIRQLKASGAGCQVLVLTVQEVPAIYAIS